MDTTTQTAGRKAEIVVAPERRRKAGLTPSLLNPAWTAGLTEDQGGWYAAVKPVPGHPRLWELSRLDGESRWTIDAAWRNGLPLFANGYGARYLLTTRATQELGDQLDELIR